MEIGIVGLPNVGKSTLFNALLKKQIALAANYPFATIEPNVGVVGVPDERLKRLAEVVKTVEVMEQLPPEVPATVTFVDIAGLVAGASKGEGLGNKFLSHIREVDAIAEVVRDFSDENVIRAGSENPKSDHEVIETELILADLETVTRIRDGKDKTRHDLSTRMAQVLEQGKPARSLKLTDEEAMEVKQWNLLTIKPVITVLNGDETDLLKSKEKQDTYPGWDVVVISAKMESELAGLDEMEQKEYLAGLGVKESGLERLIQKAFGVLGLQTFLTAGKKEVRAWTIKKGAKAPQAAGVIHTDFEKHFIKADVIDIEEFVKLGGWDKAREEGKVRMEGREYVMREGDVVEFKVGV